MTLTIPSPTFLTDAGQNIDLFPASSELTVAQAAKILDMQEDCLDGLLTLGAIEYREDGGCRLIKHNDLVDYEQDRKRMHEGILKIVRLSEEMGLYDE